VQNNQNSALMIKDGSFPKWNAVLKECAENRGILLQRCFGLSEGSQHF